MIEFKNNEDGYFMWLMAHPDGFVLNVRFEADPEYVVLHRASCGTISSDKLPPGAYTNRKFRKWCAKKADDLRPAAMLEGREDGSFSKHCGICNK